VVLGSRCSFLHNRRCFRPSMSTFRSRSFTFTDSKHSIGVPYTDAGLRSDSVPCASRCLHAAGRSDLRGHRASGASLPAVLIYHITNAHPQLSLNVLAQVIPGALLPGNPIANMVSDHYHAKRPRTFLKPSSRSSNVTA
jgi:hypothetical protein